MITLIDALHSLRPQSEWSIQNKDYSTLEWLDNTQSKPSEAELATEVSRLEAEWNATEYQRLRAAEYPPMSDYLDGVVKGDQAQIDKYIADCQAVKAKYPKPE